MIANAKHPYKHPYHYTEVVAVGGSGATIKVGGDTRTTSWQDLRAAAGQDAVVGATIIDETTRELARRYRILLATAYGMWIDQARAAGCLLIIRKFEVGCRFGTQWGLARTADGPCLVRTGVEPFGTSSGIGFLQQWADERGYAIGARS